MNIAVLVRMVPDLVEELVVDASGASLDAAWVRLIISEFDDHALEQAILLKERQGGQVTVMAPEANGIEDVLYTAAARGADQIIKLSGSFESANNHALARAAAPIVAELRPDLVLTGVQAHNDLDGPVGPLLAELLGWPFVGYVSGITVGEGVVTVRKEHAGGLIAEMEVTLPALLGVQAAEKPPRYVAVSRIRQAMSTAKIVDRGAGDLDPSGGPAVARMFRPQIAKRAEMIEGEVDDVAARLIEVFKEGKVL